MQLIILQLTSVQLISVNEDVPSTFKLPWILTLFKDVSLETLRLIQERSPLSVKKFSKYKLLLDISLALI